MTSALLTIESFTGHRLWRVAPVAGEPMLASVTTGDSWSGPTQEARCHAGVQLIPRERRPDSGSHPGKAAPVIDCSCGLYASKEPTSPPQRMAWAAGQVRLTGRVLEGERGYRAERAEMVGDLRLIIGMGPGPAMCTTPPCREPATRVRMGSTSYLGRCSRHASDESMALDQFAGFVDAAFRKRYGVGLARNPR